MADPVAKVHEEHVQITLSGAELAGDLVIPKGATGVVLFAHGSGSGRRSPRNRYVARTFQLAGLATLLIDLLTEAEEAVDLRTAHLRFDIDFLAKRLGAAAVWLVTLRLTQELRIGYFGASTGAAAALVAAARKPQAVGAIVSRGGRPDLAGDALSLVRAPTLLIVGGNDTEVVALNRQAFALLHGPKRIEIVSGATHLFEEPGALERVAELATDWFLRHLGRTGRPA